MINPLSNLKSLFPVFLFCLLISKSSVAQYSKHPLEDKQWYALSAGANTADNVSWQAAASLSKRSDFILTSGRMAYSQELIEGKNDSCFYKKNRLAEIGLMWGDGWGGRHWYVTGSLGMGLNLRMYCDSSIENNTTLRYVSAVTIGIPAQVEAGLMITENFGINTIILANWNFRQPYIGAHIGMIYRFKHENN